MTFDIALSGLNASSTKLEAISNNIANNSTTGFKSSRVEFSDIYSTTTGHTTGQGVSIASIRQNHEPGNFTVTGNVLDMSVTGKGFFRLENEGDASYTRNGTFSLDREGYLVNIDGHSVTGYATNDDGSLSPAVGPLRINPADLSPKPTELIEFGMNLDAEMEVLPTFDVDDANTYNFTTATTVYDSLGSPSIMTMYFHKDTPNTWSMFSFVDGQEVSQAGGDELVFTTEGDLDTINGAAVGTHNLPSFTPTTGGSLMDITMDLGEITQYNGNFGVTRIVQDGYTNGRLNDLKVEDDGSILGQYSNGQYQLMGQLTLTNFANIDGLQQIQGTSWKQTFASGAALTGKPGTASLGSVRAGSLEESNVDITKELVAMISAQRSFQANAQVITTADTISQTVISMRR